MSEADIGGQELDVEEVGRAQVRVID